VIFSKKRPYQSLSEAELITRYQGAGNAAYAEELFRRYEPQVFGVCLDYLNNNMEDSKDATVEIFEKVCISLLKSKVANFKNWLYTVTINHCRDKLRRQRRQPEMIGDDEELEELLWKSGQFERHEDDEGESDQIHRLRAAMRQLPAPQKICLEKLYWEEKSYKEIAEITGFPENRVRSHIQNGKRNLRNMLNR
jgi:RNA polymerase sigma-70 factor (ECF subfamily)